MYHLLHFLATNACAVIKTAKSLSFIVGAWFWRFWHEAKNMVEDGPKRTEKRAGELVRIFPHPPPSLLARPCNIPLIYCFKPIPPILPIRGTTLRIHSRRTKMCGTDKRENRRTVIYPKNISYASGLRLIILFEASSLRLWQHFSPTERSKKHY